ncbi:MAG: thermonuclease family protein [Actinobacteria bacterium]|nr:thermonuclease family protein [Actinomycetota bacterium]
MRESQRLRSHRRIKFRNGKAVAVICIAVAAAVGFLIGYITRPADKDGDVGPCFEQALVTSVIDGDTIVLDDGRTKRYLGIDTPESGEPFDHDATEKNKELVGGKVVELMTGQRDLDEYGRHLRYIFTDGVFVNAELVAQGYAKA